MSLDYLKAKAEGLQQQITQLKEDHENDRDELWLEITRLRTQTWNNTKWILIATGFTAAIVFAGKITELYLAIGGHKG